MNKKPSSSFMKLLTVIFVFSFVAAKATDAAIPVIFSGGNGSPLSIEFPYSVEFEITRDGIGPAFNILKVGGPAFSTVFNLGSGMTFQYNDDPELHQITTFANDYAWDDFEADSIYFFGPHDLKFTVGSKITLNAGTFITDSNIPESFASGQYEMLVIGDNTIEPELISSELGALIPEPNQAFFCIAVSVLAIAFSRKKTQ